MLQNIWRLGQSIQHFKILLSWTTQTEGSSGWEKGHLWFETKDIWAAMQEKKQAFRRDIKIIKMYPWPFFHQNLKPGTVHLIRSLGWPWSRPPQYLQPQLISLTSPKHWFRWPSMIAPKWRGCKASHVAHCIPSTWTNHGRCYRLMCPRVKQKITN